MDIFNQLAYHFGPLDGLTAVQLESASDADVVMYLKRITAPMTAQQFLGMLSSEVQYKGNRTDVS
jgi:hypothetical protein